MKGKGKGVNAMKWVVLVLVAAMVVRTQSMGVGGKCGPFETVKEALTSYDLPGGIFPDNVESFSCVPVLGSNSYSIALRLRGFCRVTMVGDAMEFKQDVSAVISNRQLTHIKGVYLELTIPGLDIIPPYNFTMTVNGVKVTQVSAANIVQFSSVENIYSPPFPLSSFPSDPPQCDDDNTKPNFANASY